MDKAAYEKLMDIFVNARVLKGNELDAFLSDRCGSDDALHDRIMRMIDDERQQMHGTDEVNELDTEYEGDNPTIAKSGFDKWSVASNLSECKIDGYEILDELGRGAMGVVYHARQKDLGRSVALKRIVAGQLAGEEEIRRFRLEAEAAATLEHPGIVPIFEIGEYDDQPYFSMGYVAGGSLSDLLKEGPLEPEKAARISLELADSVGYAHSKGILHRDLKPGNILIDENGRTRITDFGLAKRLDGTSELTASGQILGTPSFMAPEQASGKIHEVREPADLYALGAILYHMLCGHPPFRAASQIDTLIQVVTDDPIPPKEVNRNVPVDLNTICLKCLEKKPENRYASVEEFGEDLKRFIESKPILARPRGPLLQVVKWMNRHRALSVALSICLLFLITVVCLSIGMAIQQANAATKLRNEKNKTDNALIDLKDQITETEKQEKLARAAQWQAEQAMRAGEAQKLAALSQANLQDFPQRAVLLAREAIEVTRRQEEPIEPMAEIALRGALSKFDGINLGKLNPNSLLGVSPDRKFIYALAGKRGLLWPTDNAQNDLEPVNISKPFGGIQDVCFAPGNRLIAFAGTTNFGVNQDDYYGQYRGKTVRLFRLDKNNSVTNLIDLNTEYPAKRVLITPDGKRLFAWADQPFVKKSSLHTWDLEAEDPGKTYASVAHPGSITSLKTDGSGQRLVSSSRDGVVRVWDLGKDLIDGPFQSIDPGIGEVNSLRFSDDGKRLVASGDATRVWKFDSQINTSSRISVEGGACNLSLDSHWLASWPTKVFPQNPPVIRLVNLTSPDDRPFDLATNQTKQVLGVFFCNDGDDLIVVQRSAVLARWQLSNSDPPKAMPAIKTDSVVTCGVWSPDDKRLLLGHANGNVSVWKINGSGNVEKEKELSGHEGTVHRVEYVKGGRYVSIDVTGSIQMWTLGEKKHDNLFNELAITRTNDEDFEPGGSAGEVVASSLNGKWVVTAAGIIDRSRSPSTPVVDFGEAICVGGHFDVNNSWLVTRSVGVFGETVLWRLDTDGPEKIQSIDEVRDLTYSDDGRFLVGYDTSAIGFAKPKKLMVWKLVGDTAPTKYEIEPPHEVKAFGFSPASDILLTWGAKRENFTQNGTIATWELSSNGQTSKVSETAAPCSPGISPVLKTTTDGRWIVLLNKGLELSIRVIECANDNELELRGKYSLRFPAITNQIDGFVYCPLKRWLAISCGQHSIILIDTHRIVDDPTGALSQLTMNESGVLRNPQFSSDSEVLLASFAEYEAGAIDSELVSYWRLSEGDDLNQPVKLAEIDPGTHYYIDGKNSSVTYRSKEKWNQATFGIDALIDVSNKRVRRELTDEERTIFRIK